MAVKLNNLSPRELDALIKRASQRKKSLSKRKPLLLVRKQISKLAQAEGYTLMELFGVRGVRAGAATAKTGTRKPRSKGKGPKSGSKVAPKYRNTANSQETWSGRGKHPRWMAALIAKGKRAEDFLIK